MTKKDDSNEPRVYSKKKLNPFLMPYIMWIPYRENRKKQLHQQKLDAENLEETENEKKRERNIFFTSENGESYGE